MNVLWLQLPPHTSWGWVLEALQLLAVLVIPSILEMELTYRNAIRRENKAFRQASRQIARIYADGERRLRQCQKDERDQDFRLAQQGDTSALRRYWFSA